MMNPDLKPNRAELKRALRILARLGEGPERAEAVLSWEAGQLVIRAPGMELMASAKGYWYGTARVGLATLRCLGRAPLPRRRLVVTVTRERLYVGTLSVPCVWQASPEPEFELRMIEQ